MSPLSKTEINFRNFLVKCEKMVSENKVNEWRFPEYVSALEEFYHDLKDINTCQPSKEAMKEYEHRLQFLKEVCRVEKERPLVATGTSPEQLLTLRSADKNSRLISLQAKSRYAGEARQELLEKRRTPGSGAQPGAEDVTAVLQFHNQLQEKVANDMLELTRSLKQNTLHAREIIKKDIETLESSSHLSESNFNRLQTESDRLQALTRKSCNWVQWILLGLAFFCFLWMVIFIRLNPRSLQDLRT